MNFFDSCTTGNLSPRLSWLHQPAQWQYSVDGGLTIVPHAQSDFFRPIGGGGHDNAALLAMPVTGDFTLVAQVHVDLVAFGDAAALTVRAGADKWAKLCLERSPIGDISVVSVVTDPWSDDANNELAPTSCWLRLVRKSAVIGMHYSLDGKVWRFVRTFAMQLPETVTVGIHAQAPFTGGCRVRFESCRLLDTTPADFRSGE